MGVGQGDHRTGLQTSGVRQTSAIHPHFPVALGLGRQAVGQAAMFRAAAVELVPQPSDPIMVVRMQQRLEGSADEVLRRPAEEVLNRWRDPPDEGVRISQIDDFRALSAVPLPRGPFVGVLGFGRSGHGDIILPPTGSSTPVGTEFPSAWSSSGSRQ